MKRLMKTIIASIAIACASVSYGQHMHYRHGPYRHHHHHSYWGPGGRYFWPGFAGGLVGSMIYRPIPLPSPVIVPPPAVVPQSIVVTQPIAVPAQPVIVVR